MEIFIVSVFILGYLAITLEHSLKVDKLVPSLLMMALAWAGVAFGLDQFTMWFNSETHQLMDITGVGHEDRFKTMGGTQSHYFRTTCENMIFLLRAMTIVEIIDHFHRLNTNLSVS